MLGKMTCRVNPPSFGIMYGSISFGQLSGYIVLCIFLIGGASPPILVLAPREGVTHDNSPNTTLNNNFKIKGILVVVCCVFCLCCALTRAMFAYSNCVPHRLSIGSRGAPQRQAPSPSPFRHTGMMGPDF